MCHRDVKSFNFLVDYQLNAKIADLELGSTNVQELSAASNGVSKAVNSKIELQIEEMLANWVAPEVFRTRTYDQSADVYSLGLVLWEIVSGSLPFEGFNQKEIRAMVMNATNKFLCNSAVFS